MCLAIYKPKGKQVDETYLRRGWQNNPHGAGIAWIDGSAVKMKKGIKSIHDLLKVFYELSDETELVCHLRWATVGKKDVKNTHPFRVHDDVIFCHNGTMPLVKPWKNASDSRTYAYRDLKPVFKEHGPGLLVDEGFISRVGAEIGARPDGSPSRAIFLSPNGGVIINEKEGIWKDGVWFSNNSFRSVPTSWSRKKRGKSASPSLWGSDHGGWSRNEPHVEQDREWEDEFLYENNIYKPKAKLKSLRHPFAELKDAELKPGEWIRCVPREGSSCTTGDFTVGATLMTWTNRQLVVKLQPTPGRPSMKVTLDRKEWKVCQAI